MICAPCQRGNHGHDRHTGKVPGTRAGDDAGCPNQAVPGNVDSECECDVVLPPKSSIGRRHCPTCRCNPEEK